MQNLITYDKAEGTVTITLKHPVTAGKKTLAEVTLRTEATVADLEAMDAGKGDTAKTRLLIAELSQLTPVSAGVSVAMINKLRTGDYLAIAGVTGKIIAGTAGEDEAPEDETEGKTSPQIGAIS